MMHMHGQKLEGLDDATRHVWTGSPATTYQFSFEPKASQRASAQSNVVDSPRPQGPRDRDEAYQTEMQSAPRTCSSRASFASHTGPFQVFKKGGRSPPSPRHVDMCNAVMQANISKLTSQQDACKYIRRVPILTAHPDPTYVGLATPRRSGPITTQYSSSLRTPFVIRPRSGCSRASKVRLD